MATVGIHDIVITIQIIKGYKGNLVPIIMRKWNLNKIHLIAMFRYVRVAFVICCFFAQSPIRSLSLAGLFGSACGIDPAFRVFGGISQPASKVSGGRRNQPPKVSGGWRNLT